MEHTFQVMDRTELSESSWFWFDHWVEVERLIRWCWIDCWRLEHLKNTLFKSMTSSLQKMWKTSCLLHRSCLLQLSCLPNWTRSKNILFSEKHQENVFQGCSQCHQSIQHHRITIITYFWWLDTNKTDFEIFCSFHNLNSHFHKLEVMEFENRCHQSNQHHRSLLSDRIRIK